MNCQRGKIADDDEKKIQRNYKYLKEQIDERYLLDIFVEKEIFNLDDRDEIKCGKTRDEKNDTFLRRLCNSGKGGYKVFLEALDHAGYREVLIRLEKTNTLDKQQTFHKLEGENLDVPDVKTLHIQSQDEADGHEPEYNDAQTPFDLPTIADCFRQDNQKHDIKSKEKFVTSNERQRMKTRHTLTRQKVDKQNEAAGMIDPELSSQQTHNSSSLVELIGAKGSKCCVPFSEMNKEFSQDNSSKSLLKQLESIGNKESAYDMNTAKFTCDMYDEYLRGTGVPWYGRLTDDQVDELIKKKECVAWYNEKNQMLYITMASDADIVDAKIIAEQDDIGTWQFFVKGTDKYWSNLMELIKDGIKHGLKGRRRKSSVF